MDNWFKSKWFVRGVALFLAVLLYVFVGIEARTTQSDDRIIPSSIDVQTLKDIPVEIKIDRDRFVVSGIPEEVNVSLEGAKSILTRTVLQRNIEVFVDLTGLDEGKHLVDLEHEKIPDELTVYIEPKTIEIEIEERATEEFSVSVDFINKDLLPPGYEVGEVTVDPGEVSIMSSRSVIDKIAIVKVYVDVEGLTEPIKNREIPVNIYDSLGNVLNASVEPANVVVTVDVKNPSKEIPIEITTTGKLPDGYILSETTTEVEEIEFFGTSDVLSTITSIPTEEIDLAEITESGTIDVKLALPEDITVSNDTIEVNIKLEQTKEIQDMSIDVVNGQASELIFKDPTESNLTFSIQGAEEKIKDLTNDDFDISIDVGGLAEGEHTLPLEIKGPDGIEITTELEEVTILIN